MVIIPTCFRITPFVHEGKVDVSTWTKEKALRMLDAANRALSAAGASVKFDPKGGVCVTDEPLKIGPGDRLSDSKLLQAVADLRQANDHLYLSGQSNSMAMGQWVQPALTASQSS